jgi:hypothetical protein
VHGDALHGQVVLDDDDFNAAECLPLRRWALPLVQA